MLKKWMGLAVLVMCVQAQAEIVAHDAWSRFTAPSVPTGVVFLQMHNDGKQNDALISASSSVAKKVELHNHINDNGVMRMRQVEKIAVKAGEQVSLQPGGLHIMLMGLKQPLKKDQSFVLHLKYESGRTQAVTVKVNNGEGVMQNNHAVHGHTHGHAHH